MFDPFSTLLLQVLLALSCASAQPIWPYNNWGAWNLGWNAPLAYNNWGAWPYASWNYWNPIKPYKMPELETDYASKGKYEAVAAGGVVHKAKREADPLTIYSNSWAWPYAAAPLAYSNWGAWNYGAWPLWTGIKPYKMPELETDYASKGKYEAVAAGGVVHKAKREADPLTIYSNSWAWPTAYNNWGAWNLGWNAPLAYNNWGAWPYAWPMTTTIADDTLKADTPEYANKGKYLAVAPGVIHKA